MRDEHEATATLPELTGEPDPGRLTEPTTGIRRKPPSSNTLWQARLVLSTLEPRDIWSGRLRLAIRQGDTALVDSLLDAIYAERSTGGVAAERESQVNAPISQTVVRAASTMLPPALDKRRGTA